MRIAVLTKYVHDAGGVETYLESALPALSRRGHELVVWHEFAPSQRRDKDLGAQLPCRRLSPDNPGSTLAEWASWKPDVLFLNGLSLPSLELRLTEGRPTVTFLHAYDGTCVSGTKTYMFPSPRPCTRRLGAGCLLRYYPRRCGGLNPVVMIDRYRQQSLRRELLVRSNFVVTFSRHMCREAVAHGVADNRIVQVPAFNPAGEARPLAAHRAPSDRLHLGFVGRMERQKGAHVLMEALERLDESLRKRLNVTFAGDGRERPALEQAAARLGGIQTVFPGWIDAPAREQLFSTLDLLIVPSIWPEPLGLVGIEAASAGVPAVAFDVGGIGDWLEDDATGLLVRGTPSSRGLADAITRAVADPGRLRQLGSRALERARQYSLDVHVEALDAVLRQAAASAAASSATVSGN